MVSHAPVSSYLAFPPLPEKSGGISLLHYPWGRPRRRLAVILALGSSDFPQTDRFQFRPQPSSLLTHHCILSLDLGFVNMLFPKASGFSRPKGDGTIQNNNFGDFKNG